MTLPSLLIAFWIAHAAIGQTLNEPGAVGSQGSERGAPAQSFTTSVAGPGSNADVLNKLDKLVDQNAHLVEPGTKNLMEEIRTLRPKSLAAQTTSTSQTAKEVEPAVVTAMVANPSVPSVQTKPATNVSPVQENRKWGTYTQNLGFKRGRRPGTAI